MNLKEYLNSGIIEDYCLGVLPPDEMRVVARNAERYKEVKDTIEAYEATLKRYAEDLDLDHRIGMPNDEIRFNLLKRVKK